MFKQIIRQGNAQGVATNSIATAQIPATGTHFGIFLNFLAAAGTAISVADMKSEISNIIVRINGEQFIEGTPTFLLDLQKYYGDAIGAGNVAGILPIYWAMPHLPTDRERNVFALGMEDVDQYVVEIHCGTLVNVSSVRIFTETAPLKRRMGQHRRIVKFPQSFATTGEQELTDLPLYGPDAAYLALHIEDNAGTFQDVTVKIGNNAVYDHVITALESVLAERDFRTVQTGYYHVDFARSRDLAGMLPMSAVKDFRQLITWITAAPTTYNIYAEVLRGLNVK